MKIFKKRRIFFEYKFVCLKAKSIENCYPTFFLFFFFFFGECFLTGPWGWDLAQLINGGPIGCGLDLSDLGELGWAGNMAVIELG